MTSAPRSRNDSMRLAEAKGRKGKDKEEIEDGAGVEWTSKAIDCEKFNLSCQLDEAWNHAIEDEGNDEDRKDQCAQGSLEFCIGLLLEVIDQHDGRDAEKVQEVHTNGEADDIGQQNDVAIAFDTCTATLPLEDKPEYQSRHERREGIDLCLDSREPESIGPCVNQSTYHTR